MADNMSFLPEDYIEKKAVRRTNIVCMVLFVVVMGGVAGWYFVNSIQQSEVRELQKQVNTRFEEAAQRLEQLEELQAHKQKMLQKAQVTSVLVERVPRSLVLAELINHMPIQLSLTDLDMDTTTLRTAPRPRTALQREKSKLDRRKKLEEEEFVVEVPQTEVNLSLVGIAPTDVEIAQFMTALSRHELFYDVSLQFAEQVKVEEQEVRKFRIVMKIDQEVNVQKLEPTLVKRGLKQNPMSDSVELQVPGQIVPATAASVDQR